MEKSTITENFQDVSLKSEFKPRNNSIKSMNSDLCEIKIDTENETIEKTEIKNEQKIQIPIIKQSSKIEIQKRNKEIINLLNESILTHSTHAIIDIILTSHLMIKIFLAIFVLFSTGVASYLVIKSIMDYLAFEVTIKSRTIYETPTLFPKVTFCNLNLFTTEYAYKLVREGIYSSTNLSDEEKKQLGHDLNDILLECFFNLKKCNSSDFIWSFDSTFGNCYTFNSDFDSNGNKVDLKETASFDPYLGLYLTLYVDVYEEFLNLNTSVMYLVSTGRGALIRVGNSSYSTFYSSNGISLPAGFGSYLSVEREFKSMLPKPYSDCEIDSNSPKFKPGFDFYNLIGQSEYAYTQQLCYNQCIQNQLIKTFNCTFPYLPSLYNVSACNWSFDELFFNWNAIVNSNILNDVCLPLCPLECNQTLYKTSISYYQLFQNQFIPKIKNNPNLASDFINRTIDSSNTEKSFVQAMIFYESLSYTYTTESPQIDFVSLLGSIGGNLGLFLGINVFSLCELIEAVIEISYILKRRI